MPLSKTHITLNTLLLTLNNSLPTQIKRNAELNVGKVIQQEIGDNKLIINKADKGNIVVILIATDYNSKIHDFLDPNIQNKAPPLIKPLSPFHLIFHMSTHLVPN